MKQLASYLLTPPAVILNLYSLLIKEINLWLILAISLTTLAFWFGKLHSQRLEVKQKQLEVRKEEIEIQLLEKQLNEK